MGAYYLWWFPNTMWNVYPWGMSVNVVEPLAPDRTRVRFRSFVLDRARLGSGAGGELDAVEAEDEAVVERVQRGIHSTTNTTHTTTQQKNSTSTPFITN